MSGSENAHSGLTRRGFLKATAAGTAASALIGGVSLGAFASELRSGQPENAGDSIYQGICRPNCGQCCAIDVHVRDGKVVKTAMTHIPDSPEVNRICLRGLSHPYRIYDPERIKYPLRRVGERGSGEWERISWDEAAEEIAQKWAEIQEKYGSQAVAQYAISGGYGVFTTNHPVYLRLNNLINGSKITGCVDMANAVGINRVVGWGEGVWSTNDARDVVNAKNLFIWADNWSEAQIQEWRFFCDAIESGVNTIVIDPVYTITASKANKWVSVRPGSDAALILSMIDVIIREGLTDVTFLQEHTVAPFLVKSTDGSFLRQSDLSGTSTAETDKGDELRTFDVHAANRNTGTSAEVESPILVWDEACGALVEVEKAVNPAIEGEFEFNGIPCKTAFTLLVEEVAQYSPEKAAEICDVPADTIRELARLCADGPVTHRMGWGSQSYVNGAHPAHALITIAAITGQIGYPGASCGAADWSASSGWAQSYAPKYGASSSPTLPVLALPEIIESGEYGGEPFALKAMLIHHGNPLCTSVDINRLKRTVFDQLEHIVVVDSVMTDTACYSDLVLPVAQWFEFEDITGGGQTNFYTGFNEKAIEPLHESKTDSDIARLIAEKMGLGEYFTETDAEILDDAMLSSETCQKLGLSYASLKESKLVPQRTGVKIAFEGAKFTTPSGRMEFYVEKPVAFSNYGQDIDVERERLPRFFPPGEAWPENEKYEKYPLTLMTSRTKYQVHGQWFSVRNLRELDPDPTFRINPADARARGVEDGAWAEVFNDRGHCVAKCIYSEAVRPGSVVYMKNWAAKYFKAGSWAEVLSLEFDPVTVNHCFMDALVDVRPWSQED